MAYVSDVLPTTPIPEIVHLKLLQLPLARPIVDIASQQETILKCTTGKEGVSSGVRIKVEEDSLKMIELR